MQSFVLAEVIIPHLSTCSVGNKLVATFIVLEYHEFNLSRLPTIVRIKKAFTLPSSSDVHFVDVLYFMSGWRPGYLLS